MLALSFYLYVVMVMLEVEGRVGWQGQPGGQHYLCWVWAGVGARMWPQLLREHAEVQRIKAEDLEAEQFWAKGLGPTDIGDELAQVDIQSCV